MERGKGLWKRIASLILSLAMVLTLMPTQFAYAEGDESGGTTGGQTGDTEELPETLMYFSFDDDITDGSNGVKADIHNGADGAAECSKDVRKVGDGALRLNGVNGGIINQNGAGSYLTVPAGALAAKDEHGNIITDDNGKPIGKKDLTISYWSKVTAGTGWGTGWVYFASENDAAGGDLKYIGVFDRADAFTVECFNGGRPGSGSGANIEAGSKFDRTTDWKHVLIVMNGTDEKMILYINGKEVASEEFSSGIPNLANSTFRIGHATYNEFYNGYIDELTVYDGALTESQALMLAQQAVVEDAYANGLLDMPQGNKYNMRAGDSIKIEPMSTIPASALKTIKYESKDEAVATVDDNGVIKAVAPGETTIETSLRYNKKTYKGKTITIKVETPDEAFTPVKKYTFEDDLQGATTISKGLGDYEGTVEYAAGKDGVGKAVRTKSTQEEVPGYGIMLDQKNLGSAYTVSMWVKPENEKAFHDNGPVLALGRGKPGDEEWLSITGHHEGETSRARVWAHGLKYNTANTDFVDNDGSTTFAADRNKWTMLTITQLGNDVTFYKDGVQVGKTYKADEVLNGENQAICLGVNYWDAEFDGLYDDVYIYDSALTADQVKALYIQDADSNALGLLGDNETYDYIKSDLNFSDKFMGYDLTWTTEDTDKVGANGKIDESVLDGSTVTLKANAQNKEGDSWEKSFTLRLAKPVIIEYVDVKNNNKVVRTEKEYCKVGTKYTFEVTEDMFSNATGAYEYDETKNDEKDFTINVTEAGTLKITVKYAELVFASVDFDNIPEDVYMIHGNQAALPKTVQGIVSGDDGTEVTVPIKWDDYSELEPSEEAYTLTGYAGGFDCSVQLHIFECDESVADVTANSNFANGTVKFENGYKGIIETEYDIEITGALSTGDGAVSAVEYFDRDNKSSELGFNWWNATSTRFNGGAFFVNGGNGKGGDGTASENKNYPDAEADRTVKHDGKSTYHVRTQLDTSDVSVETGDATVVNQNGTFRVWVTDPNGVVAEVTDPQNPMTFRSIRSGVIDRAGATKQGFKVTNHKISWQSGYVSRVVEKYFGDETTPSERHVKKLLPSSLLGDDAADAYKYAPFSSETKDGVKYTLDKEKSGWFQGETKIDDPADVEVAVADATVTYKAYYGLGITNFAGLGDAVEDANALYDAAEAKGIYTADSLEELKDEITNAEELLDTEGTENPASSEDVDKAIEDLGNLAEKLVLKDLEGMEEALAAYYPLTKDVKDATDNGLDGKVYGDISFNKSTGATFPGGSAFTNYISLPDTIKVTDNMTFSFWAYDQNGGKNTFGMGSGKKVSSTGTLDGSQTAAHHFSIYVRGTGKLRAGGGNNGWGGNISEVTDVDINYSNWNLVTCVLDGKDLTVYVNGVKAKEGKTGISLTEAWDANDEERYMFLGNNIYGANGDADFKGSLKYFRIYNASLAEEQIKEIYSNEVQAQLDAAVEDLVDELLAEKATGEDAGKYTMTITDETIELPYEEKGPQGEIVVWEAEADDSAIDVDDGTVTLPATPSNETLTATIRLNGKSKKVDFLCTLKTLIAEAKATRTELKGLLKDANKVEETKYTTASFASFVTIRDAAKVAYNKADDSMTTQKAALETAMKTDGTGTLVPLGSKTALNRLITNAKKALDRADKEDYDEKVWKDLEDAIESAENLSDDVGQAEIDAEKGKLQEAYDAFKPKTYTKEQAEQLATDAKKLLEGKNEFEYDEKVWKDMQDALAEIQALPADATAEQTTAAYNKLKAAMKAFEPKTIDKAALDTLVTDAKGQLAGLNKADYEPTAWAAVDAALADIEKLPADATDEQIKAAYGKLWNAIKTLKASPFVTVSSVTLNKTALTLAVKKTETLTATVNPSNATNPAKQWKSSNDKVAKVDQNGKVTAVAKGTANITVTAGGKSATCKVTVTVPVTNVKIVDSLGGGTKPAVVAGKKITLKANITPSNASNTSVTWSVDKKSAKLASIDKKKGVLSAKKNAAGKTVTVTATANDGSKKKATIKVKIMKNAVTKITLKAGKKTVKAGKKITVKATVKTNGKKASKTLAWSIDKKSAKYASINSKGVLSTKKTGKGKTVTVTATATDGTKKKATIKIKIKK